MKNFIALSFLALIIGCSSVSKEEAVVKGEKEFYKNAIGLKSFWLPIPQHRISEMQADHYENNGTPYIIATFDSNRRLIQIVKRKNGENSYQESYFYDPDFQGGDTPYKRIRIDENGKKYSAINGMYKGSLR